MWLTKIAINRRITFIMIFLIIVCLGLVSLINLNIDLFPEITFPVVGVITTYQGVGPEDVEKIVARPIEGALSTVSGMKDVISIIREGQVMTLVRFNWGYDMDVAVTDVRDKLGLAEAFLPSDVSKPLAIKFDPSMMPIMVIGVSGRDDLFQLRNITDEKVAPHLERLEGVAQAWVWGGLEREIQINLNRDKLIAYNISPREITNAIQSANVSMPGGSVKKGGMEFIVRTVGEYSSVDEIKNTTVSVSQDGTPVLLKDVATVLDTFKEEVSSILVDGKPGVVIQVAKESDAVTVEVARRVRKEMKELEKILPPGIKLTTIIDMSEYIEKALKNVLNSLLEGFLLAILVLLIFLRNFRSTIIVGLAIPISVIATFIVMNGMGITMNLMSMGGLALAIGMLVDNSIVVMENIFRHREGGKLRIESALIGTQEVISPVIASTLTTLSVFVPVMFIPGVVGILSHDLALTVTISLITSLFVAFALIPLLAARVIPVKVNTGNGRGLFKAFKRFFDYIDTTYTRWLKWCLSHRTIFTVGVILLFLISIMLVFPFRFIGTEFTPSMDTRLMSIRMELPPGKGLEETNRYLDELFPKIQKNVPEAMSIYSQSGGGGMVGAGSDNNIADISVKLLPSSKRKRSRIEIENAIRPVLDSFPGAKVYLQSAETGTQGGPLGGASIEVEIYGFDQNIAKELADSVEAIMRRTPGAVDITSSIESTKPNYSIHIDPHKSSAVGLPVAIASSDVYTYTRGSAISKFRVGGNEYDISLRMEEPDRRTLEDVKSFPIKSLTGKMVSLGNIADVTVAASPTVINRKEQSRVVTVSCNHKGQDLGKVTSSIEKELARLKFPEGFYYRVGGQAKDQKESFFWLRIAFIAAIALVYMIMASIFESLKDPFIIMFTIPLAVIGALWMLFWTGTSLNVLSIIGIILLVGIVVNNGILLVDYTNLLRRRDKLPTREAIITGGRRRLRPVLMTALTTIIAMIPMAAGIGEGAELRAPIARSVIGGLITSTFLTLLFIPVLYSVFERLKKARKEKIQGQVST